MKISCEITLNLKIPEVQKKIEEATCLALRDTIVAIHGDTLRNAKALGMWVTGNNNRSIAAEVSGMGLVASGGEGGAERMVDDSKLEAAIYSTSGYGGYLETGTSKMPARPYIYPGASERFTAGEMAARIREKLGE